MEPEGIQGQVTYVDRGFSGCIILLSVQHQPGVGRWVIHFLGMGNSPTLAYIRFFVSSSR